MSKFFKRSLTMLTAIICVFAFAAPAFALTDHQVNSMNSYISQTYSAALKLAGRSSFKHVCARATKYQLAVLGIYEKYWSGNGRSCYDDVADDKITSGGYKVHAFSGKNCMTKLVDKCGDTLYNVLVGFEKGYHGGSDGHAVFVQAIIDGVVYFTESFDSATLGLKEGKGISLTVDAFVRYYLSRGYTFDGAAWFEEPDFDGEFVTYGLTAPEKKLKVGSSVTVRGFVNAKTRISSITAGIYNRNGGAICMGSAKPYLPHCSINKFDSKLKFSELPAGYYTYKVIATDRAETVTLVEVDFKVGNPPKCMLGDVNNDNVVNTGDASAILLHVSDKKALGNIGLAFGDVNKDGTVNTGDTASILRKIS